MEGNERLRDVESGRGAKLVSASALMESVRAARLQSVDVGGFTLDCGSGVVCRVTAVDASCTRCLFTRGSRLVDPHTWSVLSGVAGEENVPLCGRNRTAPGRPVPPLTVRTSDDGASVVMRTDKLCLTATLSPSLSFAWATPDGRIFAQDRLHRAYAFAAPPSCGLLHAQRAGTGDGYYGLGDKTGELDLSGRRLVIGMADALGNDPQRGDPGYKHWPFLVVRAGEAGFGGVSPEAAAPDSERPPVSRTVYGIYYDNAHPATFDLGCGHSNYHGGFRSFEATGGDLDYYLFLGPTLPDVTRACACVTDEGRMLFLLPN